MMDNQDKAVSRALQTRAMLDKAQLYFLYDMALMAPDGPAVECGVYCWQVKAKWEKVKRVSSSIAFRRPA